MLLIIHIMSKNIAVSGIMQVSLQVLCGIIVYLVVLLIERDSAVLEFITEMQKKTKGPKL